MSRFHDCPGEGCLAEEHAIPCSTVPNYDARTQALTGIPAEVSHGTLRGKMESQLVKELRAQVNEARAVAEQYGRELMDARFERDEALALLAEAVKSGEAT